MPYSPIPAYRAMSNATIERTAQNEQSRMAAHDGMAAARQAYIDAAGDRAVEAANEPSPAWGAPNNTPDHLIRSGAEADVATDWDAAVARFERLQAQWFCQSAWSSSTDYALDHFPVESDLEQAVWSAFAAMGRA